MSWGGLLLRSQVDENPTAWEVAGVGRGLPYNPPHLGQSTMRRKHQPHASHVGSMPLFGSSHASKPHPRIFLGYGWSVKAPTVHTTVSNEMHSYAVRIDTNTRVLASIVEANAGYSG